MNVIIRTEGEKVLSQSRADYKRSFFSILKELNQEELILPTNIV